MLIKHLNTTCRIILAGTFLYSAIVKYLEPGLFEVMLMEKGIASDMQMSVYLTRLLIAIELSLGLLYLQTRYLKRVVTPFTILMLSSFTAYLIYLVVIGDNTNCGCFGNSVKTTPLQSILKNFVLGCLALFVHRAKPPDRGRSFLPYSFVLCAFGISLLSIRDLSVKDTKLLKYTHFENKGTVDLADGDKLVTIMNLECDHCQKAASEISAFKRI
jgi:hypothetical protein